MTQDARFEDAFEAPLRLKAQGPDDLQVISALVQDSILPAGELIWDASARRFAMLLNRFRWEDPLNAAGRRKTAERVQSVLVIDEVLKVRSQGITPHEKEMILSLLAMDFVPSEDGAGTLTLTFAGDGVIALELYAIELVLKDVTRPYRAPSGKVPQHG